ncbi:hypothetical protein B5X24_HaOG212867 [Helicoverpa armigera]|uniref:Uncharacterized protein n=1 Tax=Helicoverpa armigera TaxID=29058 RepID=A0A2W1B6C8_HELAM|nr:hypothetical protein B5X24_HaOG212867 [Helicoverpa armigera]
MYGVVAGQKESGKERAQRRDRDQNDKEEKDSKKRGLTEKFMEYVKRRLNPQPVGK